MAKISISRVLERRKWTKIGSVFAALVLGFFVVQLLIIKNPWGARAAWNSTTCTLDSGTFTLTTSDTSCDGKDVRIIGSTSILTVDGTHNFKSVTTSNGGQLISATNGVAATTSGASIKKTLYPHKRAGAPVIGSAGCALFDSTINPEQQNCFNPYALQVGDIIKVVLDLYNTSGTFGLIDDYLRVPGGSYKCSIDGLYIPVPSPSSSTCPSHSSCPLNDGSGDPTTPPALHGNEATDLITGISWSLENIYNPGDIYYYCKVQLY